MRRYQAFLFIFMLALALSAVASAASDFVSGEVIVLFKDKVTPEEIQAETQRLGLSAAPGVRALENGILRQAGMQPVSRVESIRSELVKLPQGMSEDEAIRSLSQSPLVEYCGRNYIRVPMAPLPNGPQDPFYQSGQLWWLEAIQADRVVAENLLPEGEPVTIAILDTGVYLAHEDFAGRLVAGADFVDPGGNGDVPVTSWSLHGTHVAGIAAAAVNNHIGIAGAATASNIRIMPVRVMNASGGTDHNIAQGLIWAVDHGARVINMSLGGDAENPELKAAIRYAFERRCVVVVSAGNAAQNGNPVEYPAAYPHVIAVGSCDINGNWAPYSESQSYVDVAAPGGYYVSVTTTQILSTVAYTYFVGNPTLYKYWTSEGTSMAAPMVAGTAAMLLAQDPSLTPEEVENIITATAEKTGTLSRGQSWDPKMGWGRVNVYRALTYRQNATFKPSSHGRASYNYPNPFKPSRGETTRILIPLAAGEVPSDVTVKIYDAVGNPVRTLALPAAEIWPGRMLTWDGRNGQGQWVANGVYPYTLEMGGQTHRNKMVVNNQ